MVQGLGFEVSVLGMVLEKKEVVVSNAYNHLELLVGSTGFEPVALAL